MGKIYEIKFHPEALKEFCKLDGSVKILVKKQIEKLQKSPFLGEELGNKLAGSSPGDDVYEVGLTFAGLVLEIAVNGKGEAGNGSTRLRVLQFRISGHATHNDDLVECHVVYFLSISNFSFSFQGVPYSYLVYAVL